MLDCMSKLGACNGYQSVYLHQATWRELSIDIFKQNHSMEEFRAVMTMPTRGQQDTLCSHAQCTGIAAVCKHNRCCMTEVTREIAGAYTQHEKYMHTWRKSGSRSIPKNLVKNALRRCWDLPSNKDSSADTRIMSSSTAPIRAAHSLGTMGARCNAAGSAQTCNTRSLEKTTALPLSKISRTDPSFMSSSTELIHWPN